MKKLLLTLLLLHFELFAGMKISGYLPDYRGFNTEKINMLNEVIFFSAIPQKDGSLKVSPELEKHLKKSTSLQNVTKTLCVGGWGKSESFKTLSSKKDLRQTLISNLKALAKKYKLDRIDYDWEHPKGKEEENNYFKLVKESKESGLSVSIAVASWQNFPNEIFLHVESVNLMSYDNHGKHSTLKDAKLDIETLIKKGCPPAKIKLGVPFYGRHIESRKAYSYRTIGVKDLQSDEVDGIYYNGAATMKEKVKLAKSMKLGGIMIWEIEQDDNNFTLLRAIKNEIENN